MADNLQSIEKLMGSYDSQRSRLAETQKLVEKWEPTGLLEGLEDTNRQHGMAVLLENQARQLIDEVQARILKSGQVWHYHWFVESLVN